MSNFMDFSSDKVDVFLLVIDKSGSMEKDHKNVIKGLELYKKSFENFPDANSISVSVCKFDGSFYKEEFRKVKDINTSYCTGSATALFYSICKASDYLTEYIQKIITEKHIVPKATFILFSDGEPCYDRMNEKDGKAAIRALNAKGVTTVFVAFGEAIESEFGKRLGFQATIDVKNRNSLVNFLGVELSKSCKEQSKSMKGLGANFFSQANKSSSKGYSGKTQQALEDDSWIDDI